jgi:site-specific recombinase XerC
MGNLFKPTYTRVDPKTGKRVRRKVSKWYGKFRDASGKVQSVPLSADKTAAGAMLTDLIRRSRLQQAGLLDPAAEHLAAPLEGHLYDFKAHLEAKARSEKHISETLRVIGNVVASCRLKVLADLQNGTDQLEQHLAQRRQSGASHRTVNADLVAVRSFCRWLISRKRMHSDPTRDLAKLNEDEDPRMERRALTAQEAELLIATTFESKRVVRRLTGPDRAKLYLLAQRTGLRRGELRRLRARSFDFSKAPATVTVRAATAKGRRKDVLPLAADVANVMRSYVAERAPDDLVWPGSWWRRSAKMFQRDLADAGIRAVDERGRIVDFHGQRTTFITALARAGVTPATAQKLARHTDINLTLNTYTHLEMDELAGAVDKLPQLGSGLAGSNGAAPDVEPERSSLDKEIQRVVEVWPQLTQQVKARILRLIDRAS